MTKKKLADFKTQRANANRHTERGLSLLDKSIRQDGWIGAVTVAADGETFDGSARLETIATAMSESEPIIVDVDGTRPVILRRTDIETADDPRAKRLAVAANAIASADWNPDGDLLAQLAAEDDYIAQLVKNDDRAAKAVLEASRGGGADAEPQVDRAAELQAKWQTATGQLWQIGAHRLLCGDSTKREDVERVMGGEKALVFSDAPYGVDIVQNNKVGGENLAPIGNYSPIVGDETTDAARSFYSLCCELGLSDFILWGGNYFTDFLKPSPCWIIWDKRGDMNSNNFADCEMAWTSFDKPARVYKQVWAGMIREGEHDSRVHPTQKPVKITKEIMTDFFSDCYYDGFAGSGTTLVACQNLSRRCRAIEISPAYCAVILERMQAAFPGIEIKLLE